jgi:hypothetical protein
MFFNGGLGCTVNLTQKPYSELYLPRPGWTWSQQDQGTVRFWTAKKTSDYITTCHSLTHTLPHRVP